MEKFSGKPSGMPFDKFDEKVISWGRMKYGKRYAKALWRNELIDLKALDLSDELDQYKFDEHCSLVNDVISCESPKYAASLLKDKRFLTLKWQIDCRYRFREKLFCHLETLCSEEAGRQLTKRGVSQMDTKNQHAFFSIFVTILPVLWAHIHQEFALFFQSIQLIHHIAARGKNFPVRIWHSGQVNGFTLLY